MVQVSGKRARPVPVLILPHIRAAMDMLESCRSEQSIMPANKHFFCTDSHNGSLSHCHVLRKCAEAAGCVQPDVIRSTQLRKYMATVSQVVF